MSHEWNGIRTKKASCSKALKEESDAQVHDHEPYGYGYARTKTWKMGNHIETLTFRSKTRLLPQLSSWCSLKSHILTRRSFPSPPAHTAPSTSTHTSTQWQLAPFHVLWHSLGAQHGQTKVSLAKWTKCSSRINPVSKVSVKGFGGKPLEGAPSAVLYNSLKVLVVHPVPLAPTHMPTFSKSSQAVRLSSVNLFMSTHTKKKMCCSHAPSSVSIALSSCFSQPTMYTKDTIVSERVH